MSDSVNGKAAAQRWRARVAGGLAVALGLVGVGALTPASVSALDTNYDMVTLNASGGNTATDGLRILVGPGNHTIYRNGLQQTFISQNTTVGSKPIPYNGVMLRVGTDIACWTNPEDITELCYLTADPGDTTLTEHGWDTASTTLTDGTGPTYQAVSVLAVTLGGLVYTLTVTTDYTSPNGYADVTYDLNVPGGAPSDAVTLYHGIDMYLDGNDEGPTSTYTEGGKRYVVQSNETGVGGIAETTDTFSSYVGAYYGCVFGEYEYNIACDPGVLPDDADSTPYGPYDGTDYPNKVSVSDTDGEALDAGVGVNFNLGRANTIAGATTTRGSRLYFVASKPDVTLTSSFSSPTGTVGNPVTLTMTATNSLPPQSTSGIGFRLALPAGATAGTPTTNCGGSATVTGGTLRLTGGSLAATDDDCTVTVALTFASGGDKSLVAADATGLTPASLANEVSADLEIAGPPVLVKKSPKATSSVGDSYSYTFTADGSTPITFSKVSGTLPPGLTLKGSTGRLSGTPTTAGTYTFKVKATNAYGNDTTSNLTITVSEAGSPPIIVDKKPANTADVGTAYSYTFTATGSTPITFSKASGSLPPGLTLKGSTGRLSGTPTTAGTYTFKVKATNAYGNDTTSNLTITVAAAGTPPIIIDKKPKKAAEPGSPYSYQFTASGATPITFSVKSGTVPPGLSLDSKTGRLSGTPTTPGTYTFEVKATNAYGKDATTTLTIVVAGPSADVPGPVRSLTATLGKAGLLSIDWRRPADDGGSAITKYRVDYSLTGVPGWTRADATTVTDASVSDLTPGCRYDVRVRAVNAVGAGPWRTASTYAAAPGRMRLPAGDLRCLTA